MSGRLLRILKWLWILAALAFMSYLAFQGRQIILDSVSRISPGTLATSAVLIFGAKLGLAALMQLASNRFHIALRYGDAFCIYNLSQLGKYIPGSFWQFLGRIAMLRARKAPGHAIRDAMLAEHIWVLGSATVLGLLLLWYTQEYLLLSWLLTASANALPLGGYLLLAGIMLLLIYLARHAVIRMLRWCWRLRPPFRALPLLLLTWVMLGASMWVIMLPFLVDGPGFLHVLGIYCLAYVIGFLVPFAPAGLGVREGILALGLLPYLDAEVIILLAAINRLIYLGVEILAVGPCLLQEARTRQDRHGRGKD